MTIRRACPDETPLLQALVERAYAPWVPVVGRRPMPMDDDYAARLDFAEAEARRRGLPEVRLYTNERMERNIALYAARGYAEIERQQGAGFRRVFMAKRVG